MWSDDNILAFRLRYRFEKTARVPTKTATYTKGANNDSLFMSQQMWRRGIKQYDESVYFFRTAR